MPRPLKTLLFEICVELIEGGWLVLHICFWALCSISWPAGQRSVPVPFSEKVVCLEIPVCLKVQCEGDCAGALSDSDFRDLYSFALPDLERLQEVPLCPVAVSYCDCCASF